MANWTGQAEAMYTSQSSAYDSSRSVNIVTSLSRYNITYSVLFLSRLSKENIPIILDIVRFASKTHALGTFT